jgi:hypothetical protein
MDDCYYLVFDVESVGLHGEGFAIGWTLRDNLNNEYDSGYFACPLNTARGDDQGRKWVKDNVPSLKITHPNPKSMRDDFFTIYEEIKNRYKNNTVYLVTDCGWPVEARFLNQMIEDDLNDRYWNGPYPLLDVSSILFARGLDPLKYFVRLENEYPVHNPLADARQSARVLYRLLNNKI